MEFKEKTTLLFKIGQVFRPGTPINKYDLLAGRQGQITDILQAINQTGKHIVIFGERGVGKTSLSNVLSEFLTASGVDILMPANINCDSTDNFAKIWFKVFREIGVLLKTRNRETPIEINIKDDDLYYDTPDDIRYVLNSLAIPVIIVLDEVDRIQDNEVTTLLADTIKNLSDHGTAVTLMLIGIADFVDGLIKEHHSVERSLAQVHLQRMSTIELQKIIKTGEEHTGMIFDSEAARHIVRLSAGLPHYTHTLASHAAYHAVEQDKLVVTMDDVNVAIKKTVESPGSLLSAYERATTSSRQTLYPQVLLACALAGKSDLGYFTSASIRAPLENITGKHYDIPAFSAHLDNFCSEDRGSILQKSGKSRHFRFRFVNPLLQPFVIIHGLSKGLLEPSMLSFIEDPKHEIIDVPALDI